MTFFHENPPLFPGLVLFFPILYNFSADFYTYKIQKIVDFIAKTEYNYHVSNFQDIFY